MAGVNGIAHGGHARRAMETGSGSGANGAAGARDAKAASAEGGGGTCGCAGAGRGQAALGAKSPGGMDVLGMPATAAAAAPPAAAAPAAAVPSSPLVAQASARLTASPIALQVLQAIDQGGAKIATVPDAQFASQFGARTAGAYDPRTNTISLPAKVADDPAQLRLVLVHEGIHWLQGNVQGGAEALGGPIGQALTGAGAVRQAAPGKADMQHVETQAYLLEALVANQAGIRTGSIGTDGATGRALSYDAILAKIRATPEYA